MIVACSGHAVAAGALLLLGADARIGARGDFRIGLIETQLGMVLPRWAVELARERLSVRHFQQATVGARMYDPDGAADAGFLDTVVEADALARRGRRRSAVLGRAAARRVPGPGAREPGRPARPARRRDRRGSGPELRHPDLRSATAARPAAEERNAAAMTPEFADDRC